MANEVVKYNNEMNKVRFKGWKSRELSVFYSICSKMRDKGIDEVNLSFDELIELANLEGSNLTLDEQATLFDSIYDKMLSLSFGDDNGDVRFRFNLFSDFTRDKSLKSVKISINKKYESILNNLANNFTRFELLEFNEISGEYPKLLYRQLKQWKTTGRWEVQIDEFRKLFDVPEYYRMGNIDQKVLNPSIKELQKIKDFENLKVTKIKKGRKIDRLVFEFNEWVQEVVVNPKPYHKTKKKVIDNRPVIKRQPKEPSTPETEEESLEREKKTKESMTELERKMKETWI